MRRKTLHNNLKDLYDKEMIENAYETLGLRSDIRAQQLDLNEFIKLYEVLRER
jgi:16S rRNA A1518/A1519 N6-dimethyltransferase RsmA/KsgA/DIM1 with predicted DNA glycosylase/AP lyase activity